MASSIIVPSTGRIAVSAQRGLGVDSYDLQELYGPDTAVWRSKVLDLGLVKYGPPKGDYWFDRSRYNNHGTITGAVWVQLPSGLWVPDFDGIDDRVAVGDPDVLDFGASAPFTVSAWFRTATNARGILGKWAGGVAYNGYSLYVGAIGTANKAVFRLTENSIGYPVESVASVQDNKWHFVSAGRDAAGALSLYLDGSEANTATGTANSVSNTRSLTVGGGGDFAADWFSGSMGEVTIVNIAPSQSRHQSRYGLTRHLFGV